MWRGSRRFAVAKATNRRHAALSSNSQSTGALVKKFARALKQPLSARAGNPRAERGTGHLRSAQAAQQNHNRVQSRHSGRSRATPRAEQTQRFVHDSSQRSAMPHMQQRQFRSTRTSQPPQQVHSAAQTKMPRHHRESHARTLPTLIGAQPQRRGQQNHIEDSRVQSKRHQVMPANAPRNRQLKSQRQKVRKPQQYRAVDRYQNERRAAQMQQLSSASVSRVVHKEDGESDPFARSSSAAHATQKNAPRQLPNDLTGSSDDEVPLRFRDLSVSAADASRSNIPSVTPASARVIEMPLVAPQDARSVTSVTFTDLESEGGLLSRSNAAARPRNLHDIQRFRRRPHANGASSKVPQSPGTPHSLKQAGAQRRFERHLSPPVRVDGSAASRAAAPAEDNALPQNCAAADEDGFIFAADADRDGDCQPPASVFPSITTSQTGVLQSNFHNKSVQLRLPLQAQNFVSIPVTLFFDARPVEGSDCARVFGSLHFTLLFSRNEDCAVTSRVEVERRAFQTTAQDSASNSNRNNNSIAYSHSQQPHMPASAHRHAGQRTAGRRGFASASVGGGAGRRWSTQREAKSLRSAIGRNHALSRAAISQQSRLRAMLRCEQRVNDERWAILNSAVATQSLVAPLVCMRERVRRCSTVPEWSVRATLTSIDAPEFFIRQNATSNCYLARAGDSTANVPAIRTADLSLTFFVSPQNVCGKLCGDWSEWYALSSDLQQQLPHPPALPSLAPYDLSAVFSLASHPPNYQIMWQVHVQAN